MKWIPRGAAEVLRHRQGDRDPAVALSRPRRGGHRL